MPSFHHHSIIFSSPRQFTVLSTFQPLYLRYLPCDCDYPCDCIIINNPRIVIRGCVFWRSSSSHIITHILILILIPILITHPHTYRHHTSSSSSMYLTLVLTLVPILALSHLSHPNSPLFLCFSYTYPNHYPSIHPHIPISFSFTHILTSYYLHNIMLGVFLSLHLHRLIMIFSFLRFVT